MKGYIKNFIALITLLLFSLLFVSNKISVFAHEEIYLNRNNVPINQNLYNKLKLIGKTQQEIEYLTFEEVNEYDQINILNVETKTYYIKLDKDTGKEEQISANQYKNDLLNIEAQTISINGCSSGPDNCFEHDDGSGGGSSNGSGEGSSNSNTTPNSYGYKTLTMTLTKLDSKNALVHLNVKWDKMPKTRQKDVISISFPDYLVPIRETIRDANDQYYGSYFTKFKGSMFTTGTTCDSVNFFTFSGPKCESRSSFSQYDRYSNTIHYSEGRTTYNPYDKYKTRTLEPITYNSTGHWNDDIHTISLSVDLVEDNTAFVRTPIFDNTVTMKTVYEITINLEAQVYIQNTNYTKFLVAGTYIHFTEKVNFGWEHLSIGWPPIPSIQLPYYEDKFDSIKVTSDI